MSTNDLALLAEALAQVARAEASGLSLKEFFRRVLELEPAAFSIAPRDWWKRQHRKGATPLQAVEASERYAPAPWVWPSEQNQAGA